MALSPEERGTLEKEFERLARRCYRHPVKGTDVTFGVSTIERWYYRARDSDDPIIALGRRRRKDVDKTRVINSKMVIALHRQYRQYQDWSYLLHVDNLAVLIKEDPELGPLPSYTTIRRLMKKKGWVKKKKIKKGKRTAGQVQADTRFEQREVRSYEAAYVHALWHLDYHHSSLRVVDEAGQWHTPLALCILDDRSRLCCHIQWYLEETADCLIHGLCQAFWKRGLPRGLMTDNGAAMTAEETKHGLLDLGVLHERTLPYSPYQNGKQESFWGSLEGRLMAMLSRVSDLSLDALNEATQAWAEQEYNRREHDEIGTTPLKRLLAGTDVSRPARDSAEMRFAFTRKIERQQRRSDGTLTIDGVRFEVPSRLRHTPRFHVRYQSWNLTQAYIVDPKTGVCLARIRPQDKEKNADGLRRFVGAADEHVEDVAGADIPTYPPLLRQILTDYAACGLPSAYIPKEPAKKTNKETDHEEH